MTRHTLFKKGSHTSFPGVWQRPRNHSFVKEWVKFNKRKTLPSIWSACYTRGSVQYHLLLSVAWASALRSCLTNVNPQGLSLSHFTPCSCCCYHSQSWLLCISDCFPTKGLLLIKKKSNKQNIIPPNRDVPHIHEEKGKKKSAPITFALFSEIR